ncbi:bifunctional D-glycero-beta-D-manno-heptose-7-phosphate kinase/D-glycero-beta-D-manno-heptose 1-phosphate adenylyltransferase HldE [Algicola sagamiensis]|uniref:bifunctional D-glycero-beta-D-manno-heptose-7-phosphate kinase/D-glycero-beta-D-manno-heptose 1-phosphate adenylyltransferase HldE n=1 Tax=Algicola sagamiensis TaxID=163869 RepID=UPI00037BE511|nr:bifunctional D-glycero-beta-D-manno-heptose-7-phosphate kinase/D-glycero-beta-D-manno-heptose 1-phosphate adenylyltransferase HldE [Algicola sagamiensis]
MDLSVFQRLSQAKVLVVGDVMLDSYWQGDSSRISPEAPIPVVKVDDQDDKVGGAANVARNIAHLDGKVALMGIIGEDDVGQRFSRLLEEEKIEQKLVKQSKKPTIAKLRVISRHQQMLRLDFEQTFEKSDAETLANEFESLVDDYEFIVFSDYNKGSLLQIQSMIQLAKSRGKCVLIDPKQKDLSSYAGADLITPNRSEFILAGGLVDSEESIVTSARDLMQRHQIGAILLTRSEQGMSLITPDDKVDFPAQVLEVSDVTGAGDTVVATFATMLAAGASMSDAACFANLAAGIVVAKLGAATATPEELAAKLNTYLCRSAVNYRTNFSEVLSHIEFAKQSGETIVFTNGCFDILHAGHVKYLQEAKALGDRLVVGMNVDASVERLKGANRPVNTLSDRAEVLGALGAVDWVIPFGSEAQEHDTPAELIRSVMPDILVKGGDYTVDTIVGADTVQQNGGKVIVLDFVDGRSTTKIIEKIQANDA